jgi:single-strand DNA-binding protein
MNKSILIGRLTANPQLRYTPSGTAVAQFTLAISRSFTGQDGKKETDFIPIVVWQKTAEVASQHLRKGQKAAVEGRIQTRSYENKEGRKIYVTEVVADHVEFLSVSHSNQNVQQIGNSPTHQDAWNISDDDLPF